MCFNDPIECVIGLLILFQDNTKSTYKQQIYETSNCNASSSDKNWMTGFLLRSCIECVDAGGTCEGKNEST